eukprot:TRINITY_DN203_c0_g1_i2.p1 TRINITY_DN203_c0_g1~~TRINITY_DN203_c0_g1_i2.p1  ORF type:complete len:114 (+),score=18.86 TRINITY_DN203_c0_g1_i2:243-584(+)
MGCAGAKGRRADPDVPGDSRKQATSKECVAKATSKQPAAMAIVGTREATPSELTDIVTQLRLEFPDDSEWTSVGLYHQMVAHGADIADRGQFIDQILPLLVQQGLVILTVVPG